MQAISAGIMLHLQGFVKDFIVNEVYVKFHMFEARENALMLLHQILGVAATDFIEKRLKPANLSYCAGQRMVF